MHKSDAGTGLPLGLHQHVCITVLLTGKVEILHVEACHTNERSATPGLHMDSQPLLNIIDRYRVGTVFSATLDSHDLLMLSTRVDPLQPDG